MTKVIRVQKFSGEGLLKRLTSLAEQHRAELLEQWDEAHEN